MAQQWELKRASGVCEISGRELQEGEVFYTVLFEDGETFRRADYAEDAWQGPPEGCFCFFKTRVPVKEKKKKLLVDAELLINFFQRLEDEEEPVRVQFRFVLALLLMRKRLLRYDGSAVADDVETWEMTLMHNRTKQRVVNPRLSDDQIEDVSRQLGAILHSDMGDWADDGLGDSNGASEEEVPDAPS